jgi:WS/DGAT/MGAT family acyltransferase
MEWMSPVDSSFLHVENDTTPMHIGAVSIFDGPPPPFAELRAMVAGKLGLVPRYRQKVRFVPLAAGPPVWIDDPHFSLDYHLRHTAIPKPGSEEQLRQMAARVFSQHLDRDKPLWELWAVEGLQRKRWALLSKVHHCMVDGVAATDLMSVMFSDATLAGGANGSAGTPGATGSNGREAGDRPPARQWTPAPEPTGAQVLARTLLRRASPAGQLEALRRMAGAPRETLRSLAEVVRATAAASGSMRPVAASSLIGPVGPHRRWSWAHARLSDVKAVRNELGGTVNDVVLTLITNGFRELLDSRGEDVPEDRVVRTMVPVSVRRKGERGVYNNRVSAVFAGLPVGLTDPATRLQRIRLEMDGSRSPSRPSPATCSRRCPASRRRCCSRWGAVW